MLSVKLWPGELRTSKTAKANPINIAKDTDNIYLLHEIDDLMWQISDDRLRLSDGEKMLPLGYNSIAIGGRGRDLYGEYRWGWYAVEAMPEPTLKR